MRKYWFLVLLCGTVLAFSCQNSSKSDVKNDEKQDEENVVEVKDENFDEFYSKFITDMEFQIERVHFPISGMYYEEEVAEEWTKENWQYLKTDIKDIDKNEFEVNVETTETSVEHNIQLPNSGFGMNYKFELIDHKWYLTELNESNF